jgi:hypothetical protein
VLAQKRVLIPSKNASQLGYSIHTPAEWPYFIPRIKPKVVSHTSKRLQDVSRYLSNCKSIPVGMRSNLTADDYLYATSAFEGNQETIRTVEFNIVVPILSGILGLGADKMFPDMLIAPGKAWIEFDLLDYRKAFYTTMDPCRRVPGTIRDYVPFTGTAFNQPRFPKQATVLNGEQVNDFLGVERMLPMYADIPRSARDGRGGFTVAANILLGDSISAVTTGFNTRAESKDGATICYNANACKGLHYMPHPSIASQNYVNATLSAGKFPVCSNVINSSETRQVCASVLDHNSVYSSNHPDTNQTASMIAKYVTNAYPGSLVTGVRAVRGNVNTGSQFVTANYTGATDEPVHYQRFEVQNICNVGGIPIPQYVPVKTPWVVKDGKTPCIYCPENEACYGTYLKQAVAQSSRTVYGSMNNPPPGVNYTTYTTSYTVSNVELITEQILLPDAVTSQVLEGASAGAITYHTTFIGSVVQQAVASNVQNQILTVTGASVNNLTLLFRSSAQTSGESDTQAYNYLSFYNPFASVEYDSSLGTGSYDVGGKYTIKNSLSSKKGSNFNLQLKIGNEFIPRTPIRDLATLIMENEKGVQTIADYTSKLPYHCPMINTVASNSNVESYFDYAPLEDGFLAAFIPLEALDDQTITGNPFFSVVDYDLANTRYQTATDVLKKTAGVRCQVPSVPESESSGRNDVGMTYTGTLNKFVPLDGTFHMCFNLDTFVLEGGSARCGTTIVNNQLFLQCQGMHFMEHKVRRNQKAVEILAIWQQDAKIVFEAGGNCISYI